MTFIDDRAAPLGGPRLKLKGRLLTAVGMIALAFVPGKHALAQTVSWQGTIDDDWTNGANWSGGQVPDASHRFVFIKPTAPVAQPVIDDAAAMAQTLYLGSVNGASLSIRNGGVLDAGNIVISNSDNGGGPSSGQETGSVTVTGNGSMLNNEFMTVGYYGTGGLTVADGGQVASTQSQTFGLQAGSKGTLTVSGAGTRFDGKTLYFGAEGEGILDLSGQATITSETGGFGVNAGSKGTGTVDGVGTSWTMTSSSLTLGGSGEGTLTVSGGAVVSAATTMTIGSTATGNGTLIVSGAGSRASSAGYAIVGSQGTGRLSVSDGGQFSASFIPVGLGPGVGTLELSGAGTLVNGNAYVMLGTHNQSVGIATVSEGATLKATGLYGIMLGLNAGSSGTLNIGAAAGQAAAGAGIIDAVYGIQFGQGSGRLVLNHTSSDYVLGTAIKGIGAIDVLAGTTVLAGNNSNFSGSLNIDGGKAMVANTMNAASTVIGGGGTLQIGNGGTTGSLNSDITNNGALVFNHADALVHNRTISGTGTLTVAGGQITLGGMNSFTGATTIDAGATLALSGQGRINQSSNVTVNGIFDVTSAASAQIKDLAGTGTVIVGDAGLIVNNATQTFSGGITGTGGLTVMGGTLILAGDAAVTSLGIGSGAGITIGTGSTTGSTSANVTNFGTLTFARSDDHSYAGAITGPGSVIKTGANTLTFTGSMSGGQLKVEQGTALFQGTINSDAQVGADGILVFANPGTTANRGKLSGTGAVTKAGGGTLTLSGDSSAFAGTASIDGGTLLLTGKLGGDVKINAGGTLQVGNGVRDGDLLADATNNGTLIFQQTGDYNYTGALSGNGGIIKRGDGLLLLSGDYNYSGSTVVESGLMRLAAQLDAGTDLVVNNGIFDLGGRDQQVAGLRGTSGTLALGAGTLTVTQGESSSFDGAITGSGRLIKAGTATLNLTGESSFTGQVDVNGGRLAINGALPGSIVVNSTGTLGGNGTAGALTVRRGGKLAPGNSIGTLNITGDVRFEAGSVYEVEVNADGASDKLMATGRASIEGGTVSVLAAAGNYRWSSDYVILSAAGGVTGTFSGTNVDLPFLTPSLRYAPNEVVLSLIRNDRSFASVATTSNQRAIALALDAGNQTGALYRTLAGQTGTTGAVQGFDALSGELWPTAGTMMVDRTRRLGEAVLGRMEQADIVRSALSRSEGSSTNTRNGLTVVWAQAIGSWNSAKSNGNASRATQSSYGFITGVDQMLGDWRLGLAFSHGEDQIRVNGRASRADVTANSLAVYAGGGFGALRTRVGASYSWLDVDGTRNVIFPGISEDVSGAYDGKAASAFGEVSYGLTLDKAMIEPFAGVNYVHLKTEGFTESGGALTELVVSRTTRDITYTTLGLRLGAMVPVSQQATITPRVSAAWLHGFGDVKAIGRHSLSTGEAFSIEGLPVVRNALRLEAGVQANIVPGGSLGFSYLGNLSDQWRDHGLKLGFSYSF